MRGVFLSIIAFLTSCFIFTKCADEEISDKIIPVVAHFDKQYYFNYQYEKAIELGLLYANSLKILEEYSLQIIFETDELEEVFSRFITDKKPPVAIIGLGTTQRHVEVNEINEVFEKVPVVGLSTASLAASKNSYRLTVPEDRISNAIGSLIKAADWHRVAIVHESGSFGVSITNDLASILEDSGREYFVYPCIDEEDSTFETIYQGIFDRGATVLILKGYTNFMKNFLVYGIKKSYIGINSDESLLIVIHSDASCDALLLKIDAAAVLLAHHLSGHLCVENVSDIRGNFESDYWDPYVGQNDLTNAERDGSGMSHWKGDNMDAFVPFAYDSVLWLSYAIRQICELNSETEMSGCYEKLSDTSEGNIFAKTLSTFSIHGFTGTASTEPYHRTVVNYYGKEYNREDETSTVKWIPIANHLGGINDTIAQSSLDTIVWPDGTNNVHKDMFLVETSFEVKMIYTVSGLIAVSAATVLVRSLRTKKRGFSFGLYGKLDTAGVILVAIVTLFSASFFLGAETTSGKCVVMFGAEFLPFLMLLMISLGLIRFHDVLLNKSLSRVSYIGTNYKLKWVTIFLVGWIIWIIFRIVVFGGIDDVLRLHDPDWNTYWSVCKWNGGLYLEEENGAYILGISKLLLFVGFFALCYALCYRLTHFGKQSLKKSRRYMIFVFLRRMFATGLMMYVLASAILLTVPYSSLSTKPEHCEQSNSHSEHEDMNGFDDCKLKISSNAVLWFKSFSGTSRIFTTLVCVTTVAAELIYIHQMKRRQLRKRKRKIFDRDEDLAQTSTKIDKRFDLQAEIVPKRAFDFLSRRKKGGMFGKSLKYSATGGTVMDIINNKNNGVDQTLIVNQIIKGNLPVISEGDSQIDTNHDNSRKTESKVRDISFMRNSDLITNNQSIFNTQDADVILATNEDSKTKSHQTNDYQNDFTNYKNNNNQQAQDNNEQTPHNQTPNNQTPNNHEKEITSIIASSTIANANDDLETEILDDNHHHQQVQVQKEVISSSTPINATINTHYSSGKIENMGEETKRHFLTSQTNCLVSEDTNEGSSSSSDYVGQYCDMMKLLNGAGREERINIFRSLEDHLIDLKTKHLFEQLHVKSVETSLHHKMEQLEILSIRLKRTIKIGEVTVIGELETKDY